ncbi:B-cell receptor CD22-like isoform X1 [Poeciliopsis prolifica]|uniref:B-cell receptor CD22-like isoform X1 n=1 Tax=Poeciliopsis prolifica TaxID=188132 RepID=UPI00241364DE|nr:B-cell receptor CD22-like isoform X1 [Poeciliopsis prolifica]
MLSGSRQLIWTLLLLFAEDVFSNKCFVDYPQQTICAVRGSPVVFFCIFNDIEKQEVKTFTWGYLKASKVRLILSYPGNVSGRFEYTGDNEHNCSLKIHKVNHYDAGKYFFRYNKKRCPTKHLILNVIDLNILVPKETIKEGDSVNLTCRNRCDGEERSYVYSWFKDGEAINEGPVLRLTNVSSKHSGNYTCSLKMKNKTTSGVAHVNVEYGPKNTSVFVRSSSEMGADSSNVLVCCSDAHPPVENYSWFKVADGWIQKVGHQAELLPVHGGQYLCSVSNKHGSQNSTVFTLKENPYWTFLRVMVFIISASVVLFLVMTSVIAVWRLTKNKMRAETEHLEEMQRTDGVNRLRCEDSHQSQAFSNLKVEEATTEIIYATIEFKKGRKTTIKQQDYESETVIYSTVRRN